MKAAPFSSDARWIWAGEFQPGKQQYAVFRRRFTANGAGAWNLKLAAQRDYEARLNGVLLGRGSLCDPQFQRFDSYHLEGLLAPGENELCILVYTDGGYFKSTPLPEVHGLLCELGSGGKTRFCSDETWDVRTHKGWRQPGTPFSDTTWPEIFDARLDEPEWWKDGGSRWDKAAPLLRKTHLLWGSAIPQARFFPFVNLIPNEIPQLRISRRLPKELLAVGEVLEKREPSMGDIAVRMSLEPILPLSKARIEHPERLLDGTGCARIENSDLHEARRDFNGLRNVTLIFDFGEIQNGRPRLRLTANAGAVLDIGYAPEAEEGRIQPYRSWRTPEADQYTCKEGEQEWQTFQWRQFRYLQITFRRLTGLLLLHGVSVEQSEYPFEERGSFSCDRETFNRAVAMCRRSAELCTMERTMDNASRERRQYLGDCAAIVPAIHQFFGNPPLLEKYFRQLAEGQHSTGHFRYANPGHTHDESSLFDHSLTFPIFLYEHYLHSGDAKLVRSLGSAVLRFLEFCLTCFNEHGMATLPPYSIWFDWANIDRRDHSFLLNATLFKSLECAAALLEAAGISSPALDDCRFLLPVLRGHLQTGWFNEKHGVISDTSDASGPSDSFSEHGNSIAILWGFTTPEQTARIVDAYRNSPGRFAPASPGWTYMPAALVRGGATDLALAWIEDRVGPLLRDGLTTWPETWCLHGENTLGPWRSRDSRSVAQAAGLGASHAAFREVAGIRPLEPGMKTILVAPRPGPLQRFEVSFPTPMGGLAIAYERTPECTRYRLNSEGETRLRLSLPFDAERQSLRCVGASPEPIDPAPESGGAALWEGLISLEGTAELILSPTLLCNHPVP